MGNDVAKQEQKQLSPGERFTQKVMVQFGNNVGEIQVTDFQKRLAQNYFIAADAAIKAAETRRLLKKRDQDPVPVTWQNIDMDTLASNVILFARMGLDPLQKNHISLIPFKNNSIGKYEITFMEGYRGIELKAKKYGLDVPDSIIVELVYTNDKFKSVKKDKDNIYESYSFEIVDDFDRGTVKGGFYYHIYSRCPEKNKLVVMTLTDIEKRKPKYASVEFWGGEKDVWVDGKKTGREHVDGWYDKMCYKTIYRAAYNDVTIDSEKIDSDYVRMKQIEVQAQETDVEQEIAENSNKTTIDVKGAVDVEHENVPPTEPEPENKQSTEEIPY